VMPAENLLTKVYKAAGSMEFHLLNEVDLLVVKGVNV
jgi:hypothetical protein